MGSICRGGGREWGKGGRREENSTMATATFAKKMEETFTEGMGSGERRWEKSERKEGETDKERKRARSERKGRERGEKGGALEA